MTKSMSRRDFMTLVGGSLGMAFLAGCAGKQEQANDAADAQATDTQATADATTAAADYEVDYGKSELYTQEDMDAAIQTIMGEFGTWKGATMQRIVYAGDTDSADAVSYCNELANGSAKFTDAIVFKSDFHSPSKEEAEGTAWEPDTDYKDYTWFLARTPGEAWQLMSWGY